MGRCISCHVLIVLGQPVGAIRKVVHYRKQVDQPAVIKPLKHKRYSRRMLTLKYRHNKMGVWRVLSYSPTFIFTAGTVDNENVDIPAGLYRRNNTAIWWPLTPPPPPSAGITEIFIDLRKATYEGLPVTACRFASTPPSLSISDVPTF